MKIVDVAEFYAEEGGGVKTYINQKLAAGAARGHEIVIIAPGPEDREEERLGGRIVWLKGPKFVLDPRYYILRTQARVHAALDREDADVVEGSSPWRGGRYTARWNGRAVKSFIFHQDPVAVYPETLLGGLVGNRAVNQAFTSYWAFLRKLSGHYDATVVSGQWLADKLQTFGVQRPVAVPFGISKSAFSPAHADPAVRAALLQKCGVAPDAKLLVGVSRFHPEKRIGTMFDGFARAAAKQPMGLVLFGGGPFDKYVRWKAARTPGVYVAGYTQNREELATALASADAFLHGSAAETYGLVVAEALCSGLPLVVPNVGGAADLAAPAYAETYTPGSAAACGDAITGLFARDPAALSQAVALAAKDRVGTMDDHFDLLFERYAEWVAEKAARS